MTSESLESAPVSPTRTPRIGMDGINRTTSSMSVTSIQSGGVPLQKVDSTLHTERATIGINNINKLQAQGTKAGAGLASATTFVYMSIYFFENDVEPLLIAGFYIILFLILVASTIEPILADVFKRNDRLSVKCEEFIIIKLRDLLGALIIVQTALISYIFSHPMTKE